MSVLCMDLYIISCDVESHEEMLNKMDEEYHLYDYYVDEYGNEGIVSLIEYPYSDKDKYPKGYCAVMVISCDEAYLPWGPMSEDFTELDSVSTPYKRVNPQSGMAMLQSMYARGIDKYPAQEWCFKKNKSNEINGYSWRLPTYNELLNIRGNYENINKAMLSVGGTKIWEEDNKYWLCNSLNENYANVLKLKISSDDLGLNDYNVKKSYNLVRAIKYIYYYKPN